MATSRDMPVWPMPLDQALRRRDERLLALGLLASRLAHDFNNLQAPLVGYITLLQEECDSSSAASGYLQTMELAGRRATRLLEQLMNAVRPQRSFRRAPTDVAALLHQTLANWRQSLPDGSSIGIAENLAPCSLRLDARHWERILQELLANAAQAQPGGGHVEISLQPVDLTVAQAAELGVEGRPVHRLTVRDCGTGLGKETLEHAFDPLFTTRAAQKAAGLGLTFVHAATRLQGGQVTLEGKPGEGATVTIWLPDAPVAEASKAGVASSPAVVAKPVKEDGRVVLLVDDDPLVLDMSKTALQRAGLTVLSADNGTDALRIHAAESGRVAVVVTDISMPGMDGYELVMRLRESNPRLPIQFISGDVQAIPVDYLEALPGPRPQLLKKPFGVQEFGETVKRLAG
jgi:two-component system, cell cycle sensor histidine kinase and response regulator CckA